MLASLLYSNFIFSLFTVKQFNNEKVNFYGAFFLYGIGKPGTA